MTVPIELHAADGLTLLLDDAPHWRIAWREADWLGPLGIIARAGEVVRHGAGAVGDERLSPSLTRSHGSDDLGAFEAVRIEWGGMPFAAHTSVRAYAQRPLLVFRSEAPEALCQLGSGSFVQPTLAWPAFFPLRRSADGIAPDTRTFGYQYAEFALPVSGDDACRGFLMAPHRVSVVEPLCWIAPDCRTLLLAPLNQFHEQIISVPPDAEHAEHGVLCGWHGDLSLVPEGFATEFAVWAAPTPRQALTEWGTLLQQRHHTRRLSRYCDDLLGKLSYWTDNGGVYYYRTEPGCDYTQTLEKVVDDLDARDVPIASVHLDSWFYSHRIPREVSDAGADLVPPSGMMLWEPRPDLFPEGFTSLQSRLGHLPLSFHSRHFSIDSPYFERYAAWRDREFAHPSGPELYDEMMANAERWGAETYEQDWMVDSFLHVRGLREVPDRAREWQENMDRAAGEHGLHLMWCMSTPADFMQSVSLRNLASIRTSGDYRYLFDNGLNWVWFLQTNAMARALGLRAFKDLFLSHGPTPQHGGEPYAEIEAMLSALSTGPVGIGDQIGHANRDLILRTCREDGVLIKPDVPIAALDRCFRHNAFLFAEPLIGECYSEHPAGTWLYVTSFNAWREKQDLAFHVQLSDFGVLAPSQPVIVYDWRRGTSMRLDSTGGWDAGLGFQDWDYRVVCPVLPGDITVFGDTTKYATMGDRRIDHVGVDGPRIHFDILGVPGSLAEINGWSAQPPRAISGWQAGALEEVPASSNADGESWSYDAATGHWHLRARIGAAGRRHISITHR